METLGGRTCVPSDVSAGVVGQGVVGSSAEVTVNGDLAGMTAFRRRVLRQCRKIPYGRTATYGQLAVKAGAAGAARAVGTCMATNRFPLIVPCHRVLPVGGRIGAFSAHGGPEMKRRLLTIEAARGS